MKLLCIDIGNTSITTCQTSKKEIGELVRLPSNRKFIALLSKYNFKSIDKVILCSVVPELSKLIVEFCNINNIDLFEINYNNSKLNLCVDNPSEVGNDRICNIMGSIKLYNSESIVIDFGTATTYDIINDKGEFAGGAIAPGIDISADYLIKKTALLKNTIYKFPNNVIGKNTTSNIQSGVMYGGLGSVEKMINLIQKETQNHNIKIIITGGFGLLISNALKIQHSYIENLTIQGMLEIFYNQ